MKIFTYLGAIVLLSGAVASAQAADWQSQPLVVTASNTDANNLLVYDTSGKLVQTVPRKAKEGRVEMPAASQRREAGLPSSTSDRSP
jgi:hypothetical protein